MKRDREGKDTMEKSWIRSAMLEETEEPVPEIGPTDVLLIAAAIAGALAAFALVWKRIVRR